MCFAHICLELKKKIALSKIAFCLFGSASLDEGSVVIWTSSYISTGVLGVSLKQMLKKNCALFSAILLRSTSLKTQYLSRNLKTALSKILFCPVVNIYPDEVLVVAWTSNSIFTGWLGAYLTQILKKKTAFFMYSVS